MSVQLDARAEPILSKIRLLSSANPGFMNIDIFRPVETSISGVKMMRIDAILNGSPRKPEHLADDKSDEL